MTYMGLLDSSGTSLVERACIQGPICIIVRQNSMVSSILFGNLPSCHCLTVGGSGEFLPYRRTSSGTPGRICQRSVSTAALGMSCLRGPFAGCKALHTSLNCCIDEVFLGGARWVFLVGNEREHSVHSLQHLCELLRVLVIHLCPYHTLSHRTRRSILSKVNKP
jgi:hypothetical protein